MAESIKPMLDHIGIPVSDLDRAKDFYSEALAPIGFLLLGESAAHAAFGIGHMPYLLLRLTDVPPVSTHVAFIADTRAQIDAFHAAAVAAGGTDNGSPGIRADYHPDYYAAFVLDPDGHNIEVVKHTPA
jgi:catechol 2,3-dioxygenase-like lactoylglutathione lyase family enzyme